MLIIIIYSRKVIILRTLFCLLPLITILILRLLIVRSNKEPDNGMSEYLERERQALFARNKDISDIKLFMPDLSGLPLSGSSDPDDAETRVIASAVEPMLDLHHMNNADIKIEYGPANFPKLSKYDQNYMYFTRDLFMWGKTLYDKGQFDDARLVLEYTLSLTDDISGAYIMLGSIYKDKGEIELISNLLKKAEASASITSKSTCKALKDMINSY